MALVITFSWKTAYLNESGVLPGGTNVYSSSVMSRGIHLRSVILKNAHHYIILQYYTFKSTGHISQVTRVHIIMICILNHAFEIQFKYSETCL